MNMKKETIKQIPKQVDGRMPKQVTEVTGYGYQDMNTK